MSFTRKAVVGVQLSSLPPPTARGHTSILQSAGLERTLDLERYWAVTEMRCTVSSVKYSGVSKLTPSTSSSQGWELGAPLGFCPLLSWAQDCFCLLGRVVGLEVSPQGLPVLAKPRLGRGCGKGQESFLFTKTVRNLYLKWYL